MKPSKLIDKVDIIDWHLPAIAPFTDQFEAAVKAAAQEALELTIVGDAENDPCLNVEISVTEVPRILVWIGLNDSAAPAVAFDIEGLISEFIANIDDFDIEGSEKLMRLFAASSIAIGQSLDGREASR